MENINNMTIHSYEDSRDVLEKASLGLRIGAFLIDHIILTAVLIVPFILFAIRAAETDYHEFFSMLLMLMLVAFVVYGLRDIVNGQSYGKYMLGIAVRDVDNALEVPSIMRLFLRNIFNFIWPVEFIILACSPSKTKFGDRIAETNVYRVSRKPKLVMLIVPIFLIVVLFTGSIIFGVFAAIRHHPSYQTALSYIEANPRIIEQIGDIEGFGFFPNGNITISEGHGQADFTIRVYGSDDDIRVQIRLVREPLGDWEVVSFRYRQ